MSDEENENESEFSADEPTPHMHAARMTEWEYHTIRLIVASEKKLMRDFYAEAYQRMVDKREAWEPSIQGERFPWLAQPTDGKTVSIATFDYQVGPLMEWAHKDGVNLRNAAYTAIYEYILAKNAEMRRRIAEETDP